MSATSTPQLQVSSERRVTCSHAGPIKAEPKGYYTRLFGQPVRPLRVDDEHKLVALGNAMTYNVEREGTLTPRIGYTYFGQFIGHDLTHDPTPLAGPYTEPEQTPNFRTPALDLDHIYAGGPELSPYLYEGGPGVESFRIGATAPGGYRRDLPIKAGHLLVGDMEDRRNLDNLLLRQLHVLFLKFHNVAVDQLQNNPGLAELRASLGEGTLFAQARRLVSWHYQWIVRHDYLRRVVCNDVWHRQSNRLSHDRGRQFRIPIEFSLAAFRFGHSMVRNAYRLNCRKKRVVIDELMEMGQRPSPLPDDYLVEWGVFFDGLPASGPQASSSFIDTSVSRAMHGLAPGIIRLANDRESPDPSNLPVRTLLRGARARLASAQEIADALIASGLIEAQDRVSASELVKDTCDNSGSILRENGLENNTPLFYYILKEAELKEKGLTLGPVGSCIVSDVIQGAIEADPDSYLNVVGPGWNLPGWRFPSGSTRAVDSLIRVVQLVGDEKLLPECEAHWWRFQFPGGQ